MLDTSGANLPSVEVLAALHPLTNERADFTVPHGKSIAEIFDIIQPDPYLRQHAHIYIGEHYISREYWSSVRPKPGALITVRAFVPPQGGAEGKDILRSVLLIAVAAAAIAFGPALGAAFGLSGALAASVGQAVIGIGGMLLVNALIPPRTNSNASTSDDSPTRFIESARNRANPFGPVPMLFGRFRMVPSLGAQWITETVGDDQYLRGLLVWGVGPIDLDPSTFKIGETLLTGFSDIQTENREGYSGDAVTTLYSSTVDQQNFQVTLLFANGYSIRTSTPGADELSVDFVLPQGCITINDDGTRVNRSVSIQMEYSVSGANDWREIPVAGGSTTFPISWTDSNGTQFNVITFTHKRTNAIRHGVTWKVHNPGAAYDVRVKRLTADNSNDQIRDEVVFTTLRRITKTNPVNSPVPVAMTAIRIRATDQLSNVIDEFTGVGTSVCLDWNGSSWVEQATRNPASLFRHALQCGALQVPYPDSAIDLDTLEYWHEYCTAKGFTFDQVRDFQSSLDDLLDDIAAAGRASQININGKRSVVIDEPKTVVSAITPRNSYGFKATKAFLDKPHGFRVNFNNELEDYRNDEIIVYIDGYTEATATKFERTEKPGLTNPTAIAKAVRFDAACAIHRPEQWIFNQDMERFVYRRGDVVSITHDVLLIGLAYGRIKALALDGSGNCTGVTVDETLDMEASISYGMTIRTVGNAALTTQVVTNAGAQTVVTFTTAIPAANVPVVGDLFGFGILGQDTDKALILAIEPQTGEGFKAQITACPYREIVYSIDAGAIPPFTSNLTPIATIPAVEIEYVRSDETVLTVGAGESLEVHVNVKVRPVTNLDCKIEARIRPSTTQEPFSAAQITSVIGNEISFGDVRTGEYVDLALRWTAIGRNPGPWSYVYNHLVVGKSTDPDPLQNMTISTYGGQAFIRWDEPTELDVLFGGKVRFRHSTDDSPTWGNSTSIGNVAQARSLLATLPLKPGTYMARVFDEAGNQSTVVMIDTAQASVIPFLNVDTIVEEPAFSGTKVNVYKDDVFIKLGGSGLWDDVADVDLIAPAVDELGGIAAVVGEYYFADYFNFGSIRNIRITVHLNVLIGSISDTIDSWTGDIDTRPDFDGPDTGEADCIVYMAITLDDPTGSPTWGPWERCDSMEIRARGAKFKAVLTSQQPDFNIYVSELGATAEEIA